MTINCKRDTRRSRLRQSHLNGLDQVEVLDDRRTLLVSFFLDAPEEVGIPNLRITGGVVVRHINIIDVIPVASDDPDVPARIEVALDRTGDGSTYHLHVGGLEGIDQRYASAPFLFFPEADDGLDCADAAKTAPAVPPPPPLDYLAKDYTGFRQLMLDRLAVTLPDWQESHIPDVGIMLVELLAYVADRLSYYQDAVATEAYLGTARKRISVRRHARLIDYRMHEGCNARALVQIDPEKDVDVKTSNLTFFLAGQDESLQFRPLPLIDDLMRLRSAYTQMEVYCWGDSECVLPKGTVSVTLVDKNPENPYSLRPGDFLILEVLVAGGADMLLPDPDPRNRHPVRVTKVTRLRDTLYAKDLLDVTWSLEDALPAKFPLGSSSSGPVTVVRGNLLLVDQGRPISEGAIAGGTPILPHNRSFTLSPSGQGQQIRRLRSWPVQAPSTTAATDWVIRPNLNDSRSNDPHVTVEADDNHTLIVHFGDGQCGRDPSGQTFEITYRDGAVIGGRPIVPVIGPGRRRSIILSVSNLSFAEPLLPDGSAHHVLTRRDPRSAMPLIETLRSWSENGSEPEVATEWIIRSDLIESGPDDPHVTVEIDNDGTAILRFGDGVCGRDPIGQVFEIAYRVGNGPVGNVGADRITRLRDTNQTPLPVQMVRNSLAACGGSAPEDLEQVRLLAPHAFRDPPMRGITADDYAALAVRVEPSLQRAAARLVSSGGRQLVRVAIDPRGGDAPDEGLQHRVAVALEPYRRVGHDIEVVRADYVPLLLVLRVELMDGYAQRHLRAALRAALGAGELPDGRQGAFHPDNLTFGTAIYGSRLIGIAQALEGVRAVTIVELARQFDRERGVYSNGVLQMAWYEVPQLDNDPLRPDHGRFVLHLAGGMA
jgi:hypothetical protein